ncbi:MAG: outer membrane beta-barrel protein [Rubripirellula sp.]
MPTPRAASWMFVTTLLVSASLIGNNAFCQEPTDADPIASESGDDELGCLNDWLVGDCFTEQTGFSVRGWLDQGFSWNPDSPRDRFNGPLSQNDRANEYQLNQLYLIAARPADTESDSISLGFQADVMYGTDAFFFHGLGLFDKVVSDSKSRFYKLAMPQLYAEIYAPIGRGVTLQMGRWYALVGYETGLATEDFFYSHTIGFNPAAYTHTGFLLSFDLTDQISMAHGLHRGADVWEDNNNDLSYTGSVTWTSCSEDTILTYAINVGPEQDERADWQDLDGSPGPDSPGEDLERVNYSLILEQQLTSQLQYVFVNDYVFQEGSQRYAIDQAEGYGVTQYMFYELNSELMAGARLEIYRDDDGLAGAGFRSENAAAPCVYTNLTLGMKIQPSDRFFLRPEIRWDWQDRDNKADTPAFDDGTSSRQFLFACDAVLTF